MIIIFWAIMLWAFYDCGFRKLDKQYKNNRAYVICHVRVFQVLCKH